MRCWVSSCPNWGINKNTGNFFSIPNKNYLRILWLEALKMNAVQVKPSTKVCSLHFDEEDIFHFSTKQTLKKGVVPKLNLPIDIVINENMDMQNMNNTDIETKLFSDNSFKIEEELHIKDENEQCLEEVNKNIKQLEGKYLKIEKKLDVTKDSCTFQYTEIETKLFSDNSFKIEEKEIPQGLWVRN